MWKFVLKRILWVIPVVIGVTLAVFVIMNVRPGDPGRNYLGVNATQEAVDAYNDSLGLNDPFVDRYMDWMKGLVKLDFGKSWIGGQSVNERIYLAFPNTLKICLYGIILTALLGIPFGVYSAVRQYTAADRFMTILAMVLACIPTFWLCNLMQVLFASKLHWLPAVGTDSWKAFIMPVFCMAANQIGVALRLTRSTMLEEVRQDYIRTVRAKGAPESSVILKHALRNSLIPVITVLGTNFTVLLGGTVFIEGVFAIQGLGTLILKGINTKDIPMIMGCVVILAVMSVFVNLLVDIVYAFIDPRIKSQYVGQKKKAKKQDGKGMIAVG